MKSAINYLAAGLLAVLAASPAIAADAVSVDAPPQLLLFAMGVAGLIAGRRLARRRKRRDGDRRL